MILTRDLTVERAQIDPATLRDETPTTDGLTELPENTVVRAPDGTPLVAYLRLFEPGDPDLDAARRLLLPLKFTQGQRAQGLSVAAKPFGYLPRHQMRGDWCKGAVLQREHPDLVRRLIRIGRRVEAAYAELAPGTFAHHEEQAAKVLEEWRLLGSRVFTGGIVNRDSAIRYHRDSGNFRATMSAMPVLRDGMDGGELTVPELGVWLPTADGTVTIFDGQDLWHGVTPMRKRHRAAHRFSAVYYSMTMLWNCLPPAAELERAQTVRMEREGRRHARAQADAEATP